MHRPGAGSLRRTLSRPSCAGDAADRRALYLGAVSPRGGKTLPGADGAGRRKGPKGGHVGHQLHGMGADAVCHRQDRRHSGQPQPALSRPRVGICSAGVGVPDVAADSRLSRLRLRRDPVRHRSGIAQRPSRKFLLPAAAAPEERDLLWRRRAAGHAELETTAGRSRRGPGRAATSARSHAVAAGRDQHPVHVGNHGIPQGRDPQPLRSGQQRPADRRLHEAHRAGQGVHSGAVLPLLRHGAGQYELRRTRLDHGDSRRVFRSACHPAGGQRGVLHRRLRRADHVHCRARAARVQRLSISARCAPASCRGRLVPSSSCGRCAR